MPRRRRIYSTDEPTLLAATLTAIGVGVLCFGALAGLAELVPALLRWAIRCGC